MVCEEGKEAVEGSSPIGLWMVGAGVRLGGLEGGSVQGRGGGVVTFSDSGRSSKTGGGRSKKSAALGRGMTGRRLIVVGAGARVEERSGVGVVMVLAISGGMAGDGVVGFTGEVGAVGTGEFPQASRNRRISSALASGGGEKLGGEGAEGDIGFWVSGKVWESKEAGEGGGGVDSGRDDGGEEAAEVERVSSVDGLVGIGSWEACSEGWEAIGVSGRRFERCSLR